MWVELAAAHDLRADANVVLGGEGMIDTGRAARVSEHRGPELSGEYPLVKAVTGVTHRRFEADAFAGPKPIERD